MRDSVVFYKSFREAISDLPEEERLKAYEAIFDYAFDEKEPEEKGIASAVLKFVKPQIDANNKRYENGKKGGRGNQTETKPKSNDNQTETKPEPNVYVNVNENVKVNENVNEKEKRTRFTPPAVEEVREYCEERNNGIDPEAFVDFYSSKGWKVGNQTMKDWKACVRTWERRHDNKASPKIEKFDMDAYLLKEMGVDTG